MKIIFLDIDGVLNPDDNINVLLKLWKLNKAKSRDQFGDLFDQRCVLWLQYIIEKTNAKIIISSSWRKSGLTTMKELWKFRNLPGEIIDITPLTQSEKLINLYADHEADRGYEIQESINTHKPERYCIVDDMPGMLKHQLFVQIDPLYGLDRHTSQKIIHTLNHDYKI